MKPKLFALILTAASLLTAACSPASEPSVAEPVASVELVAVSRSDLAVSVSGYGVIAFDPARQRVITTQIEARVTEILVQPGQIVEKGAALMRLGPSSSSGVDLARARSDAEAAQAEFERNSACEPTDCPATQMSSARAPRRWTWARRHPRSGEMLATFVRSPRRYPVLSMPFWSQSATSPRPAPS